MNMNKFNFITITGASGTGKTTLVQHYLKEHPCSTGFLDGARFHPSSKDLFKCLFSPEGISSFCSYEVLILDEVLIHPELRKSILEILEYRFECDRKTIIVEQTDTVFKQMDMPIIHAILQCSSFRLEELIKGAHFEAVYSILEAMLKIRSDRSLEFMLWRKCRSGWEATEQYFSLVPNLWNLMVTNAIFWPMVINSELKCLAMNEDGENMQSGFLEWKPAMEYLDAILQDESLPSDLKLELMQIKSWVAQDYSANYQLGLNFISSI